MAKFYLEFAKTLRSAADVYLWDGSVGGSGFAYSCSAASKAAFATDTSMWAIFNFLRSLGVDTEGHHEFDEFPHGPIRQGARFLWLDFAALYAEELGK